MLQDLSTSQTGNLVRCRHHWKDKPSCFFLKQVKLYKSIKRINIWSPSSMVQGSFSLDLLSRPALYCQQTWTARTALISLGLSMGWGSTNRPRTNAFSHCWSVTMGKACSIYGWCWEWAQAKSLLKALEEASEYRPSPLPPPHGSCFLWVRIFPFLHKTWIILCEAPAEKKLRHPQNLPSLPAAPVALGRRSSFYLLEGESFFTVIALLLTCLTVFWNSCEGDATALLKKTIRWSLQP